MNQQNLREVIKSSKTTEIYTHVSTKNISKIKSPSDALNFKERGDG